MKVFLKKYGVWENVINVANSSKKKTKDENQKEAKKNHATSLKFLLDGLPSSIKDSLGEFTSARELWLKIEEDYQGKVQGKQLEEEIEPDPIHEEVDQVLAKDDGNLMKDSEDAKEKFLYIIKNSVTVPTRFPTSTYIEVNEKELTKAKDHMVDSF